LWLEFGDVSDRCWSNLLDASHAVWEGIFPQFEMGFVSERDLSDEATIGTAFNVSYTVRALMWSEGVLPMLRGLRDVAFGV
jgi:hypothetical protein